MSMEVYEFTLYLTGPDIMDDVVLGALFEAGCDDATFGTSNGRQQAFFAREAPTFGDAVGSAIRTVESTVPGLMVVQVARDNAVTNEVAA